MKYKKVAGIVLGAAMCVSVTACSQSGKDILSGYAAKGSEVTVENVDKKEDSMIHKMGTQLEAKEMIKNTPRLIFKYTLNKAKVYANPKAAGLKEKQLIPVDSYVSSSDDAGRLTVKDEMKMQVILCDLTITNIKDDDPMITNFEIMYEGSDGNLQEIGYPIYFSHHTGGVDDAEYYHFTLEPGKTVNCQVAWSCNIKDFKNQQLYFCYQGIDEFRQLIPIDMDVQGAK